MPPAFFDRLTDSCWSYMSWYCLVVWLFMKLPSPSASLAERMDLSISLRNSDSNSWATLRMFASPSRSLPTLSWLRRLRSV